MARLGLTGDIFVGGSFAGLDAGAAPLPPREMAKPELIVDRTRGPLNSMDEIDDYIALVVNARDDRMLNEAVRYRARSAPHRSLRRV